MNLTEEHKGSDLYPSWSPDGSQIAFVSRREDDDVYVMSALGGRPRKVLSALSGLYRGGPKWSGDGTELACPLYDAGHCFVHIVSLNSLEARRLPLPAREGYQCMDLSWSLDGRYFAYVAAAARSADITQIWVQPVSGGEPIAVTEGRTSDWSPIWSTDGRRLFFVSNRGGSMDLWQQSLYEGGRPVGEPEPVTTGLVIGSAAFSPDGTKLAYSRYRRTVNVWKVPILRDRQATWADARHLPKVESHGNSRSIQLRTPLLSTLRMESQFFFGHNATA